MIKNSRNPQVLLSLISGIILIIIHSIALAQSPNQPEKNQTLGPAQVTPPAIDLEEEVAPEQTELQQSSETEDVSESADFSNQQEPLPQIKRTKDYIDPRYRPESRYIEHPNASKGLIKIDKEKVYHYKVQTSPQKNSSALKLGYYDPT